MRAKDRKAKKRRAQFHSRNQWNKRKTATLEAIAKLRRAKKKISAANMSKEMESRGYVENGKGGWRRMTGKEKEWYAEKK